MELLKGSPEDMTGRQEREVRTYDLLDSLGCGDRPVLTVLNKCDLLDSSLMAQDFKRFAVLKLTKLFFCPKIRYDICQSDYIARNRFFQK